LPENLNSVVIADKEGRIEWTNASFKNDRIFQGEIAMHRGITRSNRIRYNFISKNQISKEGRLIVEIINYSKIRRNIGLYRASTI
jgi:hypothetical protein